MSMFLRVASALVAVLLLVVPAMATQPRGTAAWTTEGWVRDTRPLLSGPGLRYDVVGSVEPGIRVRVDRCTNRWCLIRTDVSRGWISLDVLSFGQEPDHLFRGPKLDIARGGGNVCFYSGEGFTGSVFCATGGRVLPDLALIGADNAIRSIEVTSGSATVCRDRGFRSLCQVIDESQARLPGLLSGAISSIRVY